MRCISLWQPWASAVALGLKRIETRHWSTNYTGKLAIHAAKRWTGDERETAAMFAGLYDLRLAAPPLGAIVATARLVRCDRSEDILRRGIGEMEEAFGNYGPGRFGWILDDIVMLDEPVPFRGMQGLFDVPDDLLAQAGKGGLS
ncbi:ASCH domain-containing protein [Sphingomonas sp. NFX23]|uniref:ASCH domain-containing protein n=1 Tax=Sphingomonas sp. NFX23 TaxID=2819532 RepID=UPI003CFB6BA2